MAEQSTKPNVTNLMSMEQRIDGLIEEGWTGIYLERVDELSKLAAANKKQDIRDQLITYKLEYVKDAVKPLDPKLIGLDFIDFYRPNQVAAIVKTLASRKIMHAKEIRCEQCTVNSYAIYASK